MLGSVWLVGILGAHPAESKHFVSPHAPPAREPRATFELSSQLAEMTQVLNHLLICLLTFPGFTLPSSFLLLFRFKYIQPCSKKETEVATELHIWNKLMLSRMKRDPGQS